MQARNTNARQYARLARFRALSALESVEDGARLSHPMLCAVAKSAVVAAAFRAALDPRAVCTRARGAYAKQYASLEVPQSARTWIADALTVARSMFCATEALAERCLPAAADEFGTMSDAARKQTVEAQAVCIAMYAARLVAMSSDPAKREKQVSDWFGAVEHGAVKYAGEE